MASPLYVSRPLWRRLVDWLYGPADVSTADRVMGVLLAVVLGVAVALLAVHFGSA